MCTRNRKTEIIDFFKYLNTLQCLPEYLILVDSSEAINKVNYKSLQKIKGAKTKIIYSKPGLPYQRSVGWETLKSLKNLNALHCVTFLDDDCRVERNFFLALEDWVTKNPDFIGVTGVPKDSITEKGKVIKRIFSLHTNESGKVLRSGFACVPTLNGSTEWLPGLCMNIKPKYLEFEKFNKKIRIYCEDLEYSLRLLRYGQLKVNSKMIYSHKVSQINRENTYLVTKYTLGMNYWMGKNNYSPIKRPAVLWSSVGIIIIDVLTSAIKLKNFERAKGSLSFLVNLVLKRQIIQEI